MLKGYWGRILRVDLDRESWMVESLSEKVLVDFLGGRGLAAWYYHHEIAPDVDALAPENKLFFMTGPLTGTPLPGATKFQLSTKSPETRMYLCSNCGGDFGTRLRQAGYDGLAIQGAAKAWTWLSIDSEGATFHDASPWIGCSSSRVRDSLRQAVGDEQAGTMAIGPAAERLVRISCIAVDERAFGRGGAGAVLGSKRLKGIVVRRSSRGIPVSDPARVDQIARSIRETLAAEESSHKTHGTLQYVEPINELGCMPTRNFQTGTFEGIDKLDSHAMRESARVKSTSCTRCPVACGKRCEVEGGKYAGARARPEFETVALLGPNCGVSDFAAVVRAAELCDELGIDTMSTGHAVALTMELTERRLISTEDTGGVEIRFGDPDALIAGVALVGERRGIGDELAEGMYQVKLDHPQWSRYILAVKGMPFAGYDPRGFHGNALTYGTSSRGACHNTGGWTIRAELQEGSLDRYALAGKGSLVKRIQDGRAYLDSIGLCSVVREAYGFTETPRGDTLEAVTGRALTPQLMTIAERIYTLERMILNREGIRRRDDLLPERITKESIPSGATKGRVLTEEMYDGMLDEYYEARGWDEDGVVLPETARRLGLE